MSKIILTEETQSIETEGATLVFDLQLPSSGQVENLLVCVNGFQRPRGDFRAFRKRLSALMPRHATLALDNRGTGESVLRADSISIEDMALDVERIVEEVLPHLGLTEYAVLGISMGGLIAQTVAVRNPKKVSHLILVSTTSGGAGSHVPGWMRDEAKAEFKPWPADEAGMRARMEPYFGERFLKKSPLLFDLMIKNMMKNTSEKTVQNGSSLQYQASRNFAGVKDFKEIVAKTLVITGDEDKVMPPANARFLHSAIPGAQMREYPNVGHLILIEEPEKFVADVAHFLQDQKLT